MNRMKKYKGITLIALVVTIVVLLILAGVSINLITGENGIVSKAKQAAEKTEEANAVEIMSEYLAGYKYQVVRAMILDWQII